VSTPRALDLPDRVRKVTIETGRGSFAALEAMPGRGVCERRPAVLVPGYTGSKEDFLTVLQPLAAAGRRVVAIDLRGQYETAAAASPAGYAPDALAADVIAVAAEVSPQDGGVHLVGHSFGGLIARQAALAPGPGFCSLTLLGSGPAALAGPRAEAVQSLLAQLTGERPEQLPQRIAQIWEHHLEPQATADGVPMPIIGFLRDRLTRTSAAGLIAMGKYLLAAPDRTAALAELSSAPVLVLYGENDDAWPPEVQDQMAKRLGAERVCIPAAAHSPAVEAPETTAGTLTAFWNSAEAADRRRRANPGQEPANGVSAASRASSGRAGAGTGDSGTGDSGTGDSGTGGAGRARSGRVNSSASPSHGRR
jgi:pimeloyl-ACP methyl ester carboxylesterase